MRVTGGKAKGYTIEVPDHTDLRPAQDIVRESIFNIIGDHAHQALVLDLYAGTGILGIEALSRGARFCDFVENESHVANGIKRNLRHTHFAEKADVYTESARTFINRPVHQEYELIFLDPPYVEQPRDILLLIHKFLTENGLLIYLHGNRKVLHGENERSKLNENLKILDNRKYGATHLSILQKKSSP